MLAVFKSTTWKSCAGLEDAVKRGYRMPANDNNERKKNLRWWNFVMQSPRACRPSTCWLTFHRVWELLQELSISAAGDRKKLRRLSTVGYQFLSTTYRVSFGE